MNSLIHFYRPLGSVLCVGVMLLTLSACGGGETGSPPTGENEVFLTPTVNTEDKNVYHADGATITVKDWTPLPSSSAQPKETDFEEVCLNPVQVNDTDYEYRDGEGNVTAVWSVLPGEPEQDFILQTGESTVWPIDWELYAGEIFTGEEDIEAEDGKVTLYVSMTLSSPAESYLGYLDPAAETYTWLVPPVDGSFNLKLTVNSANAIRTALKYDGQDMSHFSGQFSLEPIS